MDEIVVDPLGKEQRYPKDARVNFPMEGGSISVYLDKWGDLCVHGVGSDSRRRLTVRPVVSNEIRVTLELSK